MNLLIALAIATLGGLAGWKLGLPQGVLLGSLIAIALANVSGWFQTQKLPAPVLFVMYVLIGIELGAGVDRETVRSLANAWIPAVAFIVVLMGVTVISSLVIARFTDLDLPTALFGTSPGAISGITAMAGATGANVAVVVAMHTLRVTALVFAIPWIYKLLSR